MKKRVAANRKLQEETRKTYSTPRLMYYGDVTTLTSGGGGMMADGGGAMSMAMCWIAEVLYGVDAPRTRLVRSWLTESYDRGDPIARIVVPMYSRFGVAVAGLLRTLPVLKRLFRPLFDCAVKRAQREYAGRVPPVQA